MQNESDAIVPVFVIPPSLKFVVEDARTHKQVVTLYNPYNYSLKYRVLSTADVEKYTISHPEETVKSHHRADIIIRLNDTRASNVGTVDKFRFHIMNKNSPTVIGKQDVTATIESLRSATPESDNFQTTSGIPSAPGQQLTRPDSQSTGDLAHSPSYLVLVLALVCAGGLLFPTEKEGEAYSYYRVTVNVKLVCAYVLGLVTWVILKSR